MGTPRPVRYLGRSRVVPEGAGVRVHRSIGLPGVPSVDPFLMLDHFATDNPDDYIAGFPDHPHRGFVTLTYMVEGHMEHRDSLGHHGDLRSGGAQWMKAARGVIHSEMPRQTEGVMRGFQLWINLPATEKMSAPAYQEFEPEAMAQWQSTDTTGRVLMGRHEGLTGPVRDPWTDAHVMDITLKPNASLRMAVAASYTAFFYVFAGAVTVGETVVGTHQFGVLGAGDEVEITSPQGGRLLWVAGRPLGEPVVQYGPFVMNTEAEIRRAVDDYRNGRLVSPP